MATVSVTTTNNTVDGITTSVANLIANPGADAQISLREAIVAANNTAGADAIDLTGVSGTITLASTLSITDSVSINGPGASNLIVSGNNAVRVLDISGAGKTVNIDSITIANGRIAGKGGGINMGTSSTLNLSNSTVSGNSANFGSGIYNNGTATLSNSTVSGNSTSSGNGGGIYNRGTATITNSNISGNSAKFNGGGIINSGGTVTLSNSTVSGNSATNRGGGGILNSGGPSTLTLSNSTVSGNSANYGGGIMNSGGATLSNSTVSGNSTQFGGSGLLNNFGTATLSNSTVSGNSTSGNGGGIYNNFGTTNLINSTITNNTADSDNNGAGNGGGIYNKATTKVQNTIVAGNFDTPNNAGTGTIHPDVSGTSTDQGNNLIGIDQGSSSFVNSTNGNIVGTFATPINPQLAALANNGGPTQTHALVSGSPAIDAGTNPNSLTTDQRGTGFDRVFNTATDIGAYELQPFSDLAISAANSSQAEGNSGTTNFTFTVTRTVNTSISTIAKYVVTASGTNPSDATDFGGTFPSGTVTFNVGETTQTITIPVSGDNTFEPDEDFTVTILPLSGTTLSTDTATGTIQNDDSLYQFNMKLHRIGLRE